MQDKNLLSDESLLTVREVADFLNLSCYMVRKLVEQGKLQGTQLHEVKGSKVLIPYKSIKDYINNIK
jgi:excisionase family DNA binding protein